MKGLSTSPAVVEGGSIDLKKTTVTVSTDFSETVISLYTCSVGLVVIFDLIGQLQFIEYVKNSTYR